MYCLLTTQRRTSQCSSICGHILQPHSPPPHTAVSGYGTGWSSTIEHRNTSRRTDRRSACLRRAEAPLAFSSAHLRARLISVLLWPTKAF
eukprot:6133468-Prymnesium_polylepis.2